MAGGGGGGGGCEGGTIEETKLCKENLPCTQVQPGNNNKTCTFFLF